MNHFLLLTSFILLTFSTLFAQQGDLEIELDKTYQNFARQCFEIGSNEYLIVGEADTLTQPFFGLNSIMFLRIDDNGNILSEDFLPYYQGKNFQQVSSNELIFSRMNNIYKCDIQGSLIDTSDALNFTYGNCGFSGSTFDKTMVYGNGEYAFLYSGLSLITPFQDPLISKFDAQGNEIFSTSSCFLENASIINDGSIILANFNQNDSIEFSKLSATTGNILWTKSYYYDNSGNYLRSSFKQTDNGEILGVFGRIQANNANKIQIYKIDTSGQLLSRDSALIVNENTQITFHILENGHFIINERIENCNSRISYYNSEPSLLWSKEQDPVYYDFELLSTGKIMGVGHDYLIDNPNTQSCLFQNTYIVIFDSLGTSLTAIKDDISTSNLSVYPNPARNKLNFEFSDLKTHNIKVFVYDIRGKLMISSETRDSGEINISELKSGLYIYELNTDNQSFRGKFIKEF